MADGDEAMLGELRAQERDEMIERPAVPQLHAVTPRFLGNDPTRGVLRGETRRCEQALGLTARRKRQLAGRSR